MPAEQYNIAMNIAKHEANISTTILTPLICSYALDSTSVGSAVLYLKAAYKSLVSVAFAACICTTQYTEIVALFRNMW
jgi:hypothetical protein